MHGHHVDAELAKSGGWIYSGRRRDRRADHHEHDKSRVGGSCITSTEGRENSGCIDYVIKAYEELICITEAKQYDILMGFIQNIIECESAIETNMQKLKRLEEHGGEENDIYVLVWLTIYFYGIITTAICAQTRNIRKHGPKP